MIKALRDYFNACPFLDEFARIGVDYAYPEPTNYAIQVSPGVPVKKIYSDGMKEKQLLFDFISTGFFGMEWQTNTANHEFYEKFSNWIEDNNKKGVLPELDEGKTALEIQTKTNGYIFEEGEDKAKYMIQLSLNYLTY